MQFKNDAENKCVLRTSYVHNLITNIQIFISNELGICCYILLPLDATSFANGYPTAKDLLCVVGGKDSGSNSFTICMSVPYTSGFIVLIMPIVYSMWILLIQNSENLSLKCS